MIVIQVTRVLQALFCLTTYFFEKDVFGFGESKNMIYIQKEWKMANVQKGAGMLYTGTGFSKDILLVVVHCYLICAYVVWL
jgi:hypothetical protein